MYFEGVPYMYLFIYNYDRWSFFEIDGHFCVGNQKIWMKQIYWLVTFEY